METKRLIDASALIEEITAMKKIDPYKKQRGLIERWVRNNGYDILILLVKHFPTVEAVEVEQIKDLIERHIELRENFIDSSIFRTSHKWSVLLFSSGSRL